MLDTRHDLASLSDPPPARDLRNLAARARAPEPATRTQRAANRPGGANHRVISPCCATRGTLQRVAAADREQRSGPAENTLTVAVGLVGSTQRPLPRGPRTPGHVHPAAQPAAYRAGLPRLRRTLRHPASDHPQFWAFGWLQRRIQSVGKPADATNQAQDAVRDAGLLTTTAGKTVDKIPIPASRQPRVNAGPLCYIAMQVIAVR